MQLKFLLPFAALLFAAASLAATPAQYSTDAQQKAAARRATVAAPKEGEHYKIVNPAGKTSEPTVIEFFSFHCPHCRSLEPFMHTWEQEKPANVKFQRMHVVGMFGAQGDLFAKAFYTAEVLGIGDKIQQPFFDLVQVERKPPRNEQEVAAFLAKFGVKEETVLSTMKSFPVNMKMGQAKQAVQKYRLRGVPGFVINDKYFTDVMGARGNIADTKSDDQLRREAQAQNVEAMLDKLLSDLPLR